MSSKVPPFPALHRADLPPLLQESRKADLDRLLASLRLAGGGILNGGQVESIDSKGIAHLAQGMEALLQDGLEVRVEHASANLAEGIAALRLADYFPGIEDLAGLHAVPANERLGDLLVHREWLTTQQLEEALESARNRPQAVLGSILLERSWVNENQLAEVLGQQHGMPFLKPVEHNLVDVRLEHGIALETLRSHNALPLLQTKHGLAVAVQDPSDVFAMDAIRRTSGMEVFPSVTTPLEIQKGLDLLQRASGSQAELESTESEERLRELLLNALIEGASDIHIEPEEECYRLRYRIDGHLTESGKLNLNDGQELTARIKVLAGCDISEKRLPQDGRVRFQESYRDVDLRVNTLPTVYGEKTVMRVMDRKTTCLSLEDLGISGQNLTTLRNAIATPHGLVLVTGPTGSGKTTTLYGVLDETVSDERNISTVENPVERALPGVNQTQVNYKAGLDFGTCLKALLRQDPDVIMIGEIRDRETAEIAVEAALTGHLVFATLHTNDAPGAATRLIQMGIEPFLVAATLRSVMAQRLARRLCDSCKTPVKLPDAVIQEYASFGLSEGPHFSAVGCPACRNSGYSGRLGVFEVMNVTPCLQEAIAENPSTSELRAGARTTGMQSLFEDAIRQVEDGSTTLEEALRIGGGL